MGLPRRVLGLTALALLAAACKPSRADGGKNVLTVWLAADYAGSPIFADLNREFEEAHEGVRIKLLGVPWEDMPTKVKTAIIGGKPPDIAHQHPFALGAQGFAEPLDDLWRAWGKAGEFLPGALEDATWRGRFYGLPLDINCTVLVYNRDLYREAGLPEPGPDYSFLALQADLGRLTAPARQRYGIGLTTGGWHTYAWIRANGGDLLREDEKGVRATFTDPRTVAAVRYLADLGHKHHFGPTPTSKARDYDDATTLFAVGRVAVAYTGPWDFASIRKNAPDLRFGVARFPAGLDGVRRGSVQGGGGLFVPKGAAHRELAFEWMKMATSDKYARRLAREEGRFPVKPHQYKDPWFKQDPAVRTFIGALPSARPFKLDAYPQANQAFQDAVKEAFYGADPAVSLARAQKVAQLAIDAVEGGR
ncbi:MAG: ABC transporter substrate-binding protein [Candidatus Sericytochromatia bacterium]|nr:ABC transporter substrate-binding protein [Candidatus Tanganyikabacteria bacterium]